MIARATPPRSRRRLGRMNVVSTVAACVAAIIALVAEAACSNASPRPEADASVDGGGGTAGECAVSADCRLYASNCNACTCVALPAGSVDPGCDGTKVSCIADPCLKKSASCAAGRCVVGS